jgi:hypothetical protein
MNLRSHYLQKAIYTALKCFMWIWPESDAHGLKYVPLLNTKFSCVDSCNLLSYHMITHSMST